MHRKTFFLNTGYLSIRGAGWGLCTGMVLFALTVLMHPPIWDDALEDIKNRLGGEEKGFYHFMYSRCGKATPGHPRVSEQIEMANELTAFMEKLPEDTWEG